MYPHDVPIHCFARSISRNSLANFQKGIHKTVVYIVFSVLRTGFFSRRLSPPAIVQESRNRKRLRGLLWGHFPILPGSFEQFHVSFDVRRFLSCGCPLSPDHIQERSQRIVLFRFKRNFG